jgi:Tol biopolymer transport system component
MNARYLPRLSALLLAVFVQPVGAQEAPEEWDVTIARGDSYEVDFTTDEGTWMSTDVSPDGQWIAFDLLGSVYRIPISGGEAELLTREAGVSVGYHPRYSPDGQTIAFISDRGGQNNLWIMDADGSNPRAVAEDESTKFFEPTWTPDGDYIVVRKARRSTTPGSPGQSGIWMYHRDGGNGIELVATGDESGAAWPSISQDGRYLYFHVSRSPFMASTRDATSGSWQVRRKDLETGLVVSITSGEAQQQGRASSGGGYAAEVDPSGRYVAFVRRIPNGTISYKGHQFGPRSALWLRDLRTGSERVVMDPVEQDMAEGMKTLRIIPGYDWTPDGNSIVLSQGGQIRRVDVTSGAVTTIPFTARIQRTVSEQTKAEFRITDEPFQARFLRWYAASPDGGTLAFQAIGRVYTQSLPQGTPSRVTPESFEPFEHAPTWSPDGRWIAFTSWDDVDGGHLWRVPAGGGTPQQITTEAAEYLNPVWSPDGSYLVVSRGTGAPFRGRGAAHNPFWDLVRVPAQGGDATMITTTGVMGGSSRSQVSRASFGPDGRIFFPDRVQVEGQDGARTGVVSVRPDGSDRTVHATMRFADEAVVSPDGTWVAFQEGDNVYVAPFPYNGMGGDPLELNKRGGTVPIRQVSTEGGLYPTWRGNDVLDFGSGPHFFSYRPDSETTDSVDVTLMVDRRIPDGTVALTNARIVTLDNRQVIERGTILVNGSRIACVGDCDTSGADEVIDLAGATIIPGFVDMHAHHYREHRGLQPQHDFEQAVYLAYGVTTNLDNSMWSQNVFPTGELIRAGQLVGPRTYSSGDPLYAGDGARQNEISSYEVADQNVGRLADWGAVAIKQYLQPRRDQRQWISDAARKRGLMVTSEGSDLPYNMSMIMDGQTGFEHPMSYMPLFSDAAKFFGATKTVYSPTFNVGGAGAWNEEYFFQESDVWEDPKQQTWMPWRQVIPHTRRRVLRPDTDYSFPFIAQGMADVIAEGGYGAIGSHGQMHGIGSHWEIWMTEAGTGPMGALEVASLHGAYFLGAQDDLGSITVGKLADLIVLNSNPLDDIRNTADMRYVVQGGVVYDANSLDEVWPTARRYGERWWVDPTGWLSDDKPVNYWDSNR